MKVFDKLIILQKIDPDTEDWADCLGHPIHAAINKSKSDRESLEAGATRLQRSLVFEVRYFAALEAVSYDLQSYRIVYQGQTFNITDFDDYMLQHKTVKLLGVSY